MDKNADRPIDYSLTQKAVEEFGERLALTPEGEKALQLAGAATAKSMAELRRDLEQLAKAANPNWRPPFKDVAADMTRAPNVRPNRRQRRP